MARNCVARASLLHGKLPRQIGFTGFLQPIAASWDRLSDAPEFGVHKLALVQLEIIASYDVGDRPNRVEPWAVKCRPICLATTPTSSAEPAAPVFSPPTSV